MTVAIPIWQQRVSPVLDTAARLLVVTCRDGREASRREVGLSPAAPEEFARRIVELGVDMLLCAALSLELRHALEHVGVRLRPHLCGDTEAILTALCHNQLDQPEFRMPGCRKNHRGTKVCHRRSAHVLKANFNKTTSSSKP